MKTTLNPNLQKSLRLFILFTFISTFTAFAGGYKVGDKASDFKLKDVSGKYISLSDIEGTEGYIVVFTSNVCPYAIAYEDRIIALHNEFSKKGYPVVAINPNDPALAKGDSYEAMKTRANEKNFPFYYVKDEKQEVFKTYGAERTPHFYVLEKDVDNLVVQYIGALDDNYKEESKVEKTYVADAVAAVLQNEQPDPDFTKAIGCTIKYK